ncbi:MAG TPA: hypothetical protein VF541_03610 [Longimicrobium sp.]
MSRLPLLVLPLLAACATMAPAPTGLATGTYTTTIVAADIPAGAPADMAAGEVGIWRFTVMGNGHALVSFNGQQVVDATYQVNGSEITFGADDTGEYACHTPARYTWRISGGQLYFTRVEDGCEGRVIALTAHPWSVAR